MFRIGTTLLWSAALLGASGCAHQSACVRWPSCTPVTACSPGLGACGGPEVLNPLPPAPEVVPSSYNETVDFRCIDEQAAACLAASNSLAANLVRLERRQVLTAGTGHGANEHRTAVHEKTLQYREVQRRNESAGDALELFYRLAELQFSQSFSDRSLTELVEIERNLQQLDQQGIQSPIDSGSITRQRLLAISQSAEVTAGIQQVSGQLSYLIGRHEEAPPLAVRTDLKLPAEMPDVEAAVAEAFAYRADLAVVRFMLVNLDEDTLPVARGLLSFAEAAAGSTPPLSLSSLIHHRQRAEEEIVIRRQQLCRLLIDRQDFIRAEVSQAARQVATATREAGIRQETLDLQRRGLESSEQRRGDGVSAFDINQARLEVVRSEQQAFAAVIQVHLAWVRLHRAQGLLAEECGYRLPYYCSPAETAGVSASGM